MGALVARGVATVLSPTGATTRSKYSKAAGGQKWPFLTGLLLGAGVASLLNALWSIGMRSSSSSGHPFSFIAARDLVAVRFLTCVLI